MGRSALPRRSSYSSSTQVTPPAYSARSERTAFCVATIGGLVAFSPASSSVKVIACSSRASGSAHTVAGL
jgi:hypothetical protein